MIKDYCTEEKWNNGDMTKMYLSEGKTLCVKKDPDMW
jgi:hypothetical protein